MILGTILNIFIIIIGIGIFIFIANGFSHFTPNQGNNYLIQFNHGSTFIIDQTNYNIILSNKFNLPIGTNQLVSVSMTSLPAYSTALDVETYVCKNYGC